MKLKTSLALLGALIAVVVLGTIYALLGIWWIVLLVAAVLNVVGYIVATIAANPRSRTTAFGEIMRGFLVGLNAASNATVLIVLIELFAGFTTGLIVALVLGTLNLLAVIGPLSRTEFFQGVIGYLNWLLPMSWPIVFVGLNFVLLSYLIYGITVGKVDFLKVKKMRFDGKTGTFFLRGGLFANLNFHKTAFNMGNFAFVHRSSNSWYIEHEAGHTLNLGAFGFIFHLLGAVEENATPRRNNAFSERIAESNDTGSGGSNIPMWA